MSAPASLTRAPPTRPSRQHNAPSPSMTLRRGHHRVAAGRLRTGEIVSTRRPRRRRVPAYRIEIVQPAGRSPRPATRWRITASASAHHQRDGPSKTTAMAPREPYIQRRDHMPDEASRVGHTSGGGRGPRGRTATRQARAAMTSRLTRSRGSAILAARVAPICPRAGACCRPRPSEDGDDQRVEERVSEHFAHSRTIRPV